MKTNLVLGNDHFELEQHGPIHVTKNGSYSGCIEFSGGFGPLTDKMVQSAIDNAIEYFETADTDSCNKIADAIKRIMKVPSA